MFLNLVSYIQLVSTGFLSLLLKHKLHQNKYSLSIWSVGLSFENYEYIIILF